MEYRIQVVTDIVAAHRELTGRGVAGPDGNTWVLQEIGHHHNEE